MKKTESSKNQQNPLLKFNLWAITFVILTVTACGRADNPIQDNGGFGGGGGNPGPSNFQEYCAFSNGRYVVRNEQEVCRWVYPLVSPAKLQNNFFYAYFGWFEDNLPRLTPASNFNAENVYIFNASFYNRNRNERFRVETGDRVLWSGSTQSYWGETNSGLGCDDKIRLNGRDENGVRRFNGFLSDQSPAPQGLLAEAGEEIFALNFSENYQINGSGGELLIGFNAPTSSFNRCWSIQNWNLSVEHCENSQRQTIPCPN